MSIARPLLAGRSVVVTRTRAQASSLVDRLAALGADVIELPVIAIADPVDGGSELAAAARRVADGAYGWVVVSSVNAVARFVDALEALDEIPPVRWAAVGPATASALAERGQPAAVVPTDARAEALVETFPMATPTSLPVLFPRAETVRGTLAAGLRDKGWTVDEVVAYRTVGGTPPEDAMAKARGALAIAFSSSSTVARTVELLGTAGVPPVIVTIGPVTSVTVRQAGLTVSREATSHDVGGLVEAVVAAIADLRTGEFRGTTEQQQQQRQQQQQQQQP